MEKDFLHQRILVLGKPYEIQGMLGEGAHATVWCARALYYPHSQITIKIAREKEGVSKERVQHEIWMLHEISHEHISTFIDSGTWENHLWLAMPLYQKLTVAVPRKEGLQNYYPHVLERDGYPAQAKTIPWKWREKVAVDVLADIGEAIAYLSGTGMVHADISPGNIMEKGSLLQKHCILIDWGASALIHMYPSQSFGSLHFMAPERVLGEITIQSDLFSLGVTAFYILTGHVPYVGESAELYYLSAVERDGIAPSLFEKKIHPTLDKIIRDLIRQRASDRLEPEELIRKISKIRDRFA